MCLCLRVPHSCLVLQGHQEGTPFWGLLKSGTPLNPSTPFTNNSQLNQFHPHPTRVVVTKEGPFLVFPLEGEGPKWGHVFANFPQGTQTPGTRWPPTGHGAAEKLGHAPGPGAAASHGAETFAAAAGAAAIQSTAGGGGGEGGEGGRERSGLEVARNRCRCFWGRTFLV